MQSVSNICVYCGSSSQVARIYRDAAVKLGQHLAEQGIRVVYGGGKVGLMGLLADAALEKGGEVIGVIPGHIRDLEVAHQGLTEMHVVENMHQRKRMMVDLSQAFIILPGGLGTLDEAFEILTWKQLGLHNRPIILANIGGYWNPLFELVRHGAAEGFVRPQYKNLFQEVARIEEILPAIAAQTGGETRVSDLI